MFVNPYDSIQGSYPSLRPNPPSKKVKGTPGEHTYLHKLQGWVNIL